MSNTPRTDAQLKLEAFFDGIGIVETVEVEFARELETELAEARAEIERLALELENKQYTITCASEENQQLKESLAEARAEIEKQDTLLEKCLSLLKRQKEKEEL
jgi:predicted acetyltransferase